MSVSACSSQLTVALKVRTIHDRNPKELLLEIFLDVIQPLLKFGIPWTFTPGNHDDDEAPWARKDLLSIFTLPGCVSRFCNFSISEVL